MALARVWALSHGRQTTSQASWLGGVPLDALELLQRSATRSFRGCQTLARLLVELCCGIARHRCARPASPRSFLKFIAPEPGKGCR